MESIRSKQEEDISTSIGLPQLRVIALRPPPPYSPPYFPPIFLPVIRDALVLAW